MYCVKKFSSSYHRTWEKVVRIFLELLALSTMKSALAVSFEVIYCVFMFVWIWSIGTMCTTLDARLKYTFLNQRFQFHSQGIFFSECILLVVFLGWRTRCISPPYYINTVPDGLYGCVYIYIPKRSSENCHQTHAE